MRKQFFSTELATFELLYELQLNNSYCGTALHNKIQQEQKYHDEFTIIIHRADMNSLLTLHNSPKKYWFATVHFKTAKCHSVPYPFNHAVHTHTEQGTLKLHCFER